MECFQLNISKGFHYTMLNQSGLLVCTVQARSQRRNLKIMQLSATLRKLDSSPVSKIL
jgi:hypothetical protein